MPIYHFAEGHNPKAYMELAEGLYEAHVATPQPTTLDKSQEWEKARLHLQDRLERNREALDLLSLREMGFAQVGVITVESEGMNLPHWIEEMNRRGLTAISFGGHTELFKYTPPLK